MSVAWRIFVVQATSFGNIYAMLHNGHNITLLAVKTTSDLFI